VTANRSAADPRGVDVAELCAVGLGAGLHHVGVAGPQPFDGTRVVLEERKEAGLSADMAFSYRNPSRSTDPSRTLPDVAAVVVGLRAYPAEVEPPPSDVSVPARVSRYVAGQHYGALGAGLEAVAEHLRADGWRAVVVYDQNHLVDRAAAHRAGLAWWGKNTNLLVPGAGSWFVVGEVLTDAPLAPTAAQPVADACGPCRRCLDGCPTGALVAPGVLDARRCLAWLLQAPGVFPVEFREALGDRLYGCDECQEVCPPNRRLGSSHPVPAAAAADAWVDVVRLLGVTDAQLLDELGAWYIARRDPAFLRRNLLVVLANVATDAAPGSPVEATLVDHLADERGVVRAHAVWAARRLGRPELVSSLATDPDEVVHAELAAPTVARAGST
jgi:epoxyqueuosine reductase